MGYKLAGCDVIAANDIDPEMAWHYEHNLSPPLYYLCPISDLLSAELPGELFDLDILDGSPPCSTFSTSGNRHKDWGRVKHFREGQASQVLDDLFFEFLDLADRLRPRVLVAENVKGMAMGKAKGYVRLVFSRMREIGYRPQLFLINAADCGVPQRRERVFFCALRNDIEAPRLELAPRHRWVSAREATADVKLTPDEAEGLALNSNTDKTWWPKTKPGESYSAAVERAGGKAKMWNHVKASPNRPASTLTGSDRLKHWGQRRRLSFAEWKRLGSFPDDYIAKNEKIGKYIVGMSVPPLMMKAVADAVIEQWLARQ